MAAQVRWNTATREHIDIPVICVGNLVVGGAGKTPATLMLAEMLKEKGLKPHILTRGYGASVSKPIRVDLDHHTSKDVGDEPILLAQTAPTWVCPDRVAAANLAQAAGADILIMDDGFQNPYLHKDLSFLVVDGLQGFGNGMVLPAGPLRESVASGLPKCDGLIVVGNDYEHIVRIARKYNKPVIHSKIECKACIPGEVLAFAGLGFPEKFYRTLVGLNYSVVASKSFADHHPYTDEDIEDLLECAIEYNAKLITTEKDLLRIPNKYHDKIEVLKVFLQIREADTFNEILSKVIK